MTNPAADFARRANHFVFSEMASPAPFAKIFLFRPEANQFTDSHRPVPQRGVAHVINVGHGMRWTRRHWARMSDCRAGFPVSGHRRAGRKMLKRPAKSCGSDAPRLASSFAEASRPNRALDKTISAGRRWQNSMVTEESTKEAVKTIARGMPGDFRCDRGDYARVLFLFRTRGCGCIKRTAFPAPSDFRGQDVSGKTRADCAARSRNR